LRQGLAIRGLTEELGPGTITLDIVPEPARRNVNRLKEDDLERLLEWAGVPTEMWPGLVDSLYDWTDSDDIARKDGAETEDYYGRLDPPYKAKNGPLDTVGELLLVKGFTNSILSGGVLSVGVPGTEPVPVEGIEPLLTTYGDGRVNVNAAGRDVLLTLPGMDESKADAIIQEREGMVDDKGNKVDAYFKSVTDLFGRVPGLDPSMQPYITTDSSVYRVTSVGTCQGVARTIGCIVKAAGKDFIVVRWREEE
jgi:general secretion pathway protein K